VLLPLPSSFVFGLTTSIFFANSTTFGLASNWLICSSSEPDLIIIPLFFVPEPIGFISMARDEYCYYCYSYRPVLLILHDIR
jgi:hypothetical protein